MLILSLIVAASLPIETAGSAPQHLFNPSERLALSKHAQKECGHASPQELLSLARGERDKALRCLVSTTVKQGPSFLPKEIEPGATITSASEFQGLLVFTARLAADHPRALAKEEVSLDFEKILANRTCQDPWLGGIIDAGMDEQQRGGTAIVYQFQDIKGANLRIDAIAQCFIRK